jgi:hypothetical protein
MKKLRYLFLWVIIAVSLAYTIGGCAGGGGGGDGKDGDDGMNYSGLTDAAEINELNAEDISGGAFGAGLIGDGMMALSLSQYQNNNYVNKYRAVKIPVILSDSLNFINFSASSTDGFEAALETVSEAIDGSCGGSMSYTVNADNKDGTFSGRFTFKDYCNDGTTINGKARFDGKMNIDTGEFVDAYFSFDNLSGGDLNLDGDIEIDFSASPNVINFNAYGQDPSSGKIYWIKNYSITIDEYSGFIQIEMAGRFYHPDYGYVTLSTTEPFVLHDGDEWPASGTLIVKGANSAKAKITAIDNTKCAVEADIDGDDSYEWVPETLIWDEI